MDLEVKWSPEAIENLESIAEYIARDSEYYARAVVTEILSVPKNVREFPFDRSCCARSWRRVHKGAIYL